MILDTLTTIAVAMEGWGGYFVFFISLYVLIVLGKDLWLLRLREKTMAGMKWVTLEIKIPKENLKSPKAMEQVFASLHATYTFGLKPIDKWWYGKIEDWMSLEMVGFSHSMHFYAYIQEKYRNLVESAFFSQYPGAELHVIEDYTAKFGNDLPNDTYDIFGTDLTLGKDDYFPIKTYLFFEENIEERRLDPIATISEVMSGLKDDEMLWLQLLVRPTGDSLREKAQEFIDKTLGREKKKAPGFRDVIVEFFANLINAPVQYPNWGKGGGDEKPKEQKRLSPGEQDILKAVDNKLSKLSFESLLRFIYIDKRDSFTGANVPAVMGALRQFSTQNLNALRPNMATLTVPRAVGRFFRKPRLLKRKRKLFQNYIKRDMPMVPKWPFSLYLKTSVFSVEELATLYHPPITYVGAPNLEPLEAKKGSAPSNLPIVE